MAEEERVEVEGEEKPKKGMPKLPIKLLAIIAAGVAGLVLVVIVATMAAKAVREPVVRFEPERPPEEKITAPLLVTWLAGPAEGFVANLADVEERRLVKTGEFRLAYNPEYKELAGELKDREFKISDIINTILLTKTSKDLSSEEGKEEFKREVMDRINVFLTKGQIEDIYVQIMVQ